MTADIARFSYDPTRQYRYVIRQQGRVTLEADENEGSALASESLRLETVDLIGPAIAIGSGYLVSASGNALTVGAGVFYLGGWRLELDTPVNVASQPDWLDQPTPQTASTMLIALLVTEQSVCAVEDQALREVALGGPDSAARGRLMQHFLQIPMNGNTCAEGATTVSQILGADGCSLGPDDQILSGATLQVGFVPGPPNTDPCTPAATGGYLGADNQMIRVTVSEFNSRGNTGMLVWGWNNASLLYRASVGSTPNILTLTNTPLDEEHAPQAGQWVEILRAEADLDTTNENYIAEVQGIFTYLTQGYSFDTGEIVLNDPLPADYLGNTPPLFVRLWQAAVPFTVGQATPLDSVSGITVTINNPPPVPSQIAARPFWRFAVRPLTPTAIYPERYQQGPQPPDGPRQWITDLAVVAAPAGGGWTVIADCRIPLGPPQQTTQNCDCCGLVLGPADVVAQGGLQQVINTLTQNGTPSRLSLKAGTYMLEQTLALTAQHDDLIIEGCTSGVIITADPNQTDNFATGLINLNGITGLTLENLTFTPPLVQPATGTTAAPTIAAIVITGAQSLVIEGCTFQLDLLGAQAFGGAVLVAGPAEQVALRGNTLETQGAREAPVFGVLAWVAGNNTATALNNWEITDNQIGGFYAAVFILAQLGLMRCDDNVVAACGSGIIIADANVGAGLALADAAQQGASAQTTNLAQATSVLLRPQFFANIISQGAPLITALSLPQPAALSADAQQLLTQQLSVRGTAAYTTLAGGSSARATTRAKGRAAKNAARAAAGTVDLAGLQSAAIVMEAYTTNLIPAVRIEDNEVSLLGALFDTAARIGILVLNSLPQQKQDVATSTTILSGNRVMTPDSTIPACALGFPSAAVVSGNILMQQEVNDNGQQSASLIVVSLNPALQIAANVVQYSDIIFPPRTAPAATPAWEFFNTVE
jgi:Family of unknown function (DUF6519)